MKTTYLTIYGILTLLKVVVNSHTSDEKTFVIDRIDVTEEAYFIEVSFPYATSKRTGNLRLDRLGHITPSGERAFTIITSVGTYSANEVFRSDIGTTDDFIYTLHKIINGIPFTNPCTEIVLPSRWTL